MLGDLLSTMYIQCRTRRYQFRFTEIESVGFPFIADYH